MHSCTQFCEHKFLVNLPHDVSFALQFLTCLSALYNELRTCSSMYNFGSAVMNELPCMHRSDVILVREMKSDRNRYLKADWLKMSAASSELQDTAELEQR